MNNAGFYISVFVVFVLLPLPVLAADKADAARLLTQCTSALQAGIAFKAEDNETPLQACLRTERERRSVPVKQVGKAAGQAGLLPLLTPAAGGGGAQDKDRPTADDIKVEIEGDKKVTFPAANYYLQSDGKGAGVKPIFLDR